MLFEENKKLREIFSEMRKTKFEKGDAHTTRPPQPGLFLGNKILFIGQNPGKPRPQVNLSDQILLQYNATDEEFHDAYKLSQMNWLFYKKFIKPLIGDSMDFSIMNIVFYPTTNNFPPSAELVSECRPYIIKLLEEINPKVIVCLSKIAESELRSLKLDKKYHIIFSYHYSYLMRAGLLDREIKEIKKKLQNEIHTI